MPRVKHVLSSAFFLLLALACQGQSAPDAALCDDLVNRLCAEPVCQVVTERLKPSSSCVEDLGGRAGCASADFAWGENGTPTRERILDCRLPLIRSGDSVTSAPSCEQVEESFDRCPDLERLFDGGTP